MTEPAPPVKRTRVPPTYEHIMRWLAMNPAATAREGAEFFGVTPRWWGSVVNSDLFIARYQEWMAEMDNKVLLPTLLDKVKGAASLAVDRLTESLEPAIVDPEHVRKSTEVLLSAVKPQTPHTVHNTNVFQQNTFTLDPRLDAIQRTRRAQLEAAKGNALPVIEVEAITHPEVPPDAIVALPIVAPVEVQAPGPEFSRSKVWDDLSDGLLDPTTPGK